MSLGWTILIILLVLGVVIGNITLLKYSARFKMPKSYRPPEHKQGTGFDDDEDDWGAPSGKNSSPQNQKPPEDNQP
ncbi:DUF2897 family protein [Alteromonas aestuariivivens]|uniref:DUF2897 family protein n=1 Tax=Alteromonas aestuariivivens TaxID=1938339 RepID=A0A3D8MB01_9ALTE|nr:DUF2897 family protein [Alteromonas aestuariivivens]RDV27554.1 DUF2897 family protein [Alteromonas aestuariivivens]